MVTEGARTARIVRWHAATGVAAIAASFALILEGHTAWFPIPGYHDSWHTVHLFHLGVAAPLWALLAVQMMQLRLRVAAGGAAVAAAAALASEGLTRWIEARGVDAWSSSAAIATMIGLVAAIVWIIAAARGLARGARALAQGTLLLPTVRARAAAYRLGFTLGIAVPWLGALAGFVALTENPLACIAIVTCALLSFTGAQLGLAHLIAKSRTLPTATVR